MSKMKRLLTLEDLENFYLNRKRSTHFSAKEEGEAIAIQIPATLTFSEDYDATTGLLKTHLKACHLYRNRNNSGITKEAMEMCQKSIYNRPILGYIHQLSDGSYDFAGHEMEVVDDELVYKEIPIGIIPESCNDKLVYDSDNDKTYLEVDGYIFEEYTKAADILKSKKTSKVSVEMNLTDFAYNAQEKYLQINQFYFTGVTILGVNEDEKIIEEGMYGSNIKLKDFSQENNSHFSSISEEDKNKIIEMRDAINELVSRFSIDEETQEITGKEEPTTMENLEEMTVVETDEVQTVEENASVETVENSTEPVVEENSETVIDAEKCGDKKDKEEVVDTEEVSEEVSELESEEVSEIESEEVIETEKCGDKKEDDEVSEDEKCKTKNEEIVDVEKCGDKKEDDEVSEDEKCGDKKKYSKTFELSHDDIRYSLYMLLAPYEEMNNDCYWIVSVFDGHFIYQSWYGNYYGQKYIVNEDDTVAFDGEPYALYAEFLTDSEKATLESMRANYSSIESQLNSYKEREDIANKKKLFSDYSQYLDTAEFKELMSDEFLKNHSNEEIIEKADATVGRFARLNSVRPVSNTEEAKETSKQVSVAFGRVEATASFLDALCEMTRNK